MPRRLLPLLTVLALGACDAMVATPPGGDDGSTELPPPPVDFGVVTQPRTGDTIVAQSEASSVVVRGVYTRGGAALDVQVQAPDGTWSTIASGVTSAQAASGADGDPRYPFEIAVDASVRWVRGGLLHLRVRAGDSDLIGLFSSSDGCLAAWPTVREGAQHCGSIYTGAGIVLASTDLDLVALDAATRYLDDKGTSTPDETAAYYATVGAPATLTDFRTRYFVNADEVTAAYYNAGDLATGREMHCATFPSGADTGVACYVHNYGIFGSTESDALAQLGAGVAAGNGSGAFATVAMVYTPPITAPNAVQFEVYGANQALVDLAQLDTHGDNTSVPENCTNCHGSKSTYDAANHLLTGARFLAFDPAQLDFAAQAGLTRPEQEDALRKLNQLVLATQPGYAASELIGGLYGGRVADPGRIADTGWTAPGWTGESASQVYRAAIAPYCRGCHSSREGESGGSETWDFVDPTRFRDHGARIGALVCEHGEPNIHRMPDAQATAHRFWSGPARAYLAAITGYAGDCTP